MMSLFDDKAAKVIEALNSTSRYMLYFDDMLNIDTTYFLRHDQSNIPIRNLVK